MVIFCSTSVKAKLVTRMFTEKKCNVFIPQYTNNAKLKIVINFLFTGILFSNSCN